MSKTTKAAAAAATEAAAAVEQAAAAAAVEQAAAAAAAGITVDCSNMVKAFDSAVEAEGIVLDRFSAAVAICNRLLNTASPSWNDYEAVRKGFIAAYETAHKGITANAATQAWSRLFSLVQTKHGTIKPKSGSEAAEKQAKSRVKTAEAIAKVVSEFKTPDAITKQIVEVAAQEGSTEKVAMLTIAKLSLEKAEKEAALKAVAGRWASVESSFKGAKKRNVLLVELEVVFGLRVIAVSEVAAGREIEEANRKEEEAKARIAKAIEEAKAK